MTIAGHRHFVGAHEREAAPYGVVLETFELLCMVQDLARMLRKRWDRQLRASIPDMSAARAEMLLQLGRCVGASQIRLAGLLEHSQMTVSRQLDDLERQGWVRRDAMPGDRRAWAVRLTDKGRGMLTLIHAVRRAFVQRSTAALNEESRASLMAALVRLETTTDA
jgi:DNA-binding MarR family transcriptional regulator